LNFGHSFAHALERLAGYGNISHGQAVFIGMRASVYISGLHGAAFERDHLSAARSLYEVTLPNKNRIPELIEAMRTDKKVKDETIRLVLLKKWGEPYLEAWTDESLLSQAWQAAFDEMRLL
jgi:3-dehydroquinate synthase